LHTSEIVFAAGATLKVMADSTDVAAALASGDTTLDTRRFAGFRGEDEVGGEPIVINVAAIAYAIAISGPRPAHR
jgi:hypothetical protein